VAHLQWLMEQGITPYMRTRDSALRKNSPLYGPERFTYLPESNSYLCPAGQQLNYGEHNTRDYTNWLDVQQFVLGMLPEEPPVVPKALGNGDNKRVRLFFLVSSRCAKACRSHMLDSAARSAIASFPGSLGMIFGRKRFSYVYQVHRLSLPRETRSCPVILVCGTGEHRIR
jgi:hypothetical protein